MLYTPNYNLSKAEGTDTVNLLTQNYPNFDIIDTTMKANADAGITVATETKTGTNHAIVRANTGAAVFRFTATSNYAVGDTFTVDTNVVTAVLPSGQSLPAGAFVINSTVVAVLVGTQLTVLASAGSSDADTLEGHAASYFATASDLQEVSDDAAEALDAVTAVTSIVGAETLIGTFNGTPLYRKVLSASDVSISNNVVIDASLNISYVKNVTKLHAVCKNSANQIHADYQREQYASSCRIDSTGLVLNVLGLTVTDYVVTVEYTKAL